MGRLNTLPNIILLANSWARIQTQRVCLQNPLHLCPSCQKQGPEAGRHELPRGFGQGWGVEAAGEGMWLYRQWKHELCSQAVSTSHLPAPWGLPASLLHPQTTLAVVFQGGDAHTHEEQKCRNLAGALLSPASSCSLFHPGSADRRTQQLLSVS